MSPECERFDAVVRLLDREDQLINSRMTWYLTIQGFIIAGVALICGREFEFPERRIPAIVVLSGLGIAISLVVFVSVCRARSAKRKISNTWRTAAPAAKASFPDPTGDTSRWSLLTPGLSVPLILIAFWIAVVVGVTF